MMADPPQIPYGAGLHLVLGPPNAGKLGLVLRWWMEHRVDRPVIVVPTRADVTDVELELLTRAGIVFDDAPVRTIDRLVAALRPSGPPLMGSVQRSLLLADIVSAGPPGGPLAGLGNHPGGLAALSTLLDELGDGGLAEDQVRVSLRRWAGAGGGLLADELAGVFESYVSGLKAWGKVDRHQALAAAVEGSGVWERPLAFHGFTSFTPAQRGLVGALSGRLPVVVTLAVDSRRETRGGPPDEVAKFSAYAVSETVLPRQDLAFASPAVAYLEGNFLREGAGPRSAPPADESSAATAPTLEGVRFLLSAGRRNEVESAAAEIVSLLRAGLQPDDIGVLVRRVEPWRSTISAVFQRYGVPYRLDGTVSLGATGLGFALLSAVRGLARDDLDSLLGYLRGPYHPASAAGVDAAEVAMRGDRRDGVAADALESLLSGALVAARGALRWNGGEAAAVDPEGLRSLAASMLTVSAGAASAGSSTFEQDARAFAVLDRGLDEIDGSDAGEARDDRPGRGLAHRSVETALAVLAQLPVSLGRGDEAGVVRVTTVSRARARRFPVVFVLGLVDTEFPGSERPPALLGAPDRAAFIDPDGVPILSAGERSDEAALFTLALSRPWQLLYLSGRDAEDDGGEAQLSPFWVEARRLLPGAPVGPRRGLEDVVHTPSAAPTEREFLRACAALGLVPADSRLAGQLEGLAAWECRPIRLSHPALLSVLSSREVFSATELEQYTRCPFGWFAERAVGLKTMEKDFGPLQTGGVLHQVLKVVYESLRQAGEPRLTPTLLPAALEVAEQALTAAIESMRGQWSDAELELTRAQAADLVRAFVTFDARSLSTLALAGVETSLPAAGVDLGGFRLSGRIDRIDSDPVTGALLVIDYKSGSDAHGSDFAARGALQVPLYALALRQDRSGVDAAGGVYVALKTCVRRGAVVREVAERAGNWISATDRVDGDELEVLLSDVLVSARRAAAGIRGGDIRAEPLKECPSYCSLSPLCRTPLKARAW